MRYIALFLLIANVAYFAWLHSGYAPAIEISEPPPRPLLNTGLSLLSEFEARQLELGRQQADSALQCLMISGFAGLDEALSFIDDAGAGSFTATLELGGNPLPSQFRVYLPPASSRAVATLMLEGLSEATAELDIESYLVTRGALQNAIALGVYESRGAAILAQEAIQGLGYSPEIQELPRSDGPIEVLLQPSDSQRIEESEWLDLTTERPNLIRTENLCQGVAPAGQFP